MIGIVVAPAARLNVNEAIVPFAMTFEVKSLETQVYDPKAPVQVSGLPPVDAVALTDTTFAAG